MNPDYTPIVEFYEDDSIVVIEDSATERRLCSSNNKRPLSSSSETILERGECSSWWRPFDGNDETVGPCNKKTKYDNNEFIIAKDKTSFVFQGHVVNVIKVKGKFWFRASRVAEILGYGRPSDAVAQHVERKDKRYVATFKNTNPSLLEKYPKMQPQTVFINQLGLNAIVERSQMPLAKEFKRLLPNILSHLTGLDHNNETSYLNREEEEEEEEEQEEETNNNIMDIPAVTNNTIVMTTLIRVLEKMEKREDMIEKLITAVIDLMNSHRNSVGVASAATVGDKSSAQICKRFVVMVMNDPVESNDDTYPYRIHRFEPKTAQRQIKALQKAGNCRILIDDIVKRPADLYKHFKEKCLFLEFTKYNCFRTSLSSQEELVMKMKAIIAEWK